MFYLPLGEEQYKGSHPLGKNKVIWQKAIKTELLQ